MTIITMGEQAGNINDLALEPYKVSENREIAPGVFTLSIPRRYPFHAGQVVGMALDPEQKPRLYSISSGSGQEGLQLLFNVKDDGFMTPRMAMLEQGDQIWVSKPFGSFFGTKDPAYWIAAGTGIAPFLSMFRSGQGGNKIFIHGARKLNSFYFSEELAAFFKSNYIRCCSREIGNGVFHGRVTDYLRQAADIPTDHKYFLCGSAEMVVETRDILISRGIPYDLIMAEIYF